MPLGCWSDDPDWSFHSFHGEIGLHLIRSHHDDSLFIFRSMGDEPAKCEGASSNFRPKGRKFGSAFRTTHMDLQEESDWDGHNSSLRRLWGPWVLVGKILKSTFQMNLILSPYSSGVKYNRQNDVQTSRHGLSHLYLVQPTSGPS